MANRVLLGNIKGATGPTGATGAQGVPGSNGLTPYIQNGTWWLGVSDTGVTAEGNQWFTGIGDPTTQGKNGDLYLNTNTGDVYKKSNGTWTVVANIKGQRGEKGEKGEKGETALTFSVGTTTTVDADAPAIVQNVGSDVDIVLNFSIPKGETGPQGEQGPRGERGYEGPQGERGIPGEMPPLDQEESTSTTSAPSSAYLKSVKDELTSRIEGSQNAFEFNTYSQFTSWLTGNYARDDGRTVADLKIGSDILIKQNEIPDYWCSSLTLPITSANFTAYESKQNFVRFDTDNQGLTDEQKQNARKNIGVDDDTGTAIMPSPSSAYFGKVLQYVGETTENYTSNYFYKCIEFDGISLPGSSDIIGEDNGKSYVWKRVDVQPGKVIKKDIDVGSWVEDLTYEGFGYKADISIAGLTENDFAEVVFNQAEAMSGNYASVNSTSAGIVTIYSKVNTEITIPTIIVIKGVGA